MKSGTKVCRKCGALIDIITRGIYRNVIVDAQAVDVHAEEGGEMFYRVDGSKVQEREVEIGSTEQTEPAYRPHDRTCGRRQA